MADSKYSHSVRTAYNKGECIGQYIITFDRWRFLPTIQKQTKQAEMVVLIYQHMTESLV